MIEVEILDSTAATVDGVAVVGPLHLFGESLTAGGQTWGTGYILVNASGATKTMNFTAAQSEMIPFFVCALFFLGLFFGLQVSKQVF